MEDLRLLPELTELVRSGGAGDLRSAIIRTALDGAEAWRCDWRDLYVALALYFDVASRRGIDPVRLFDEVATSVPTDLAEMVRAFGRRTDVTPSAFGFLVMDEPDGLTYYAR